MLPFSGPIEKTGYQSGSWSIVIFQAASKDVLRRKNAESKNFLWDVLIILLHMQCEGGLLDMHT